MQRLDRTYNLFREPLMGNETRSDEPIWIGLSLVILPVVTVVGNTLVVLAILFDRNLRTTTNTLLLSLAMADLLVGLVVMPPSIYLVVNNLQWFLSPALCTMFTISDVTASTASIVHLTAISADRFFAVLRHIEYATPQHRKRVRIFIICTWIVSILIGLPLVLVLDPNQHINASICGIDDYNFMLYGSVFSFYIPAGLMLVMYGLVFSKLHRRLKTVRFQEATAARVVQFTQTMMPGTDGDASSVYGSKRSRKNWDLSWAKPFVQSLEDKARTPGTDHVSRKDLRELTVILAKLESHEFNEDNEDDCAQDENHVDKTDDVYYMEVPSTKDKESSLTAINKRPSIVSSKSIPRPIDVRCRTTITRVFGSRLATICGAERLSKKLAAKKLQFMRARAYRLLMKLKSKQGIAIRKENRATKLVAIVMIVFLICWLPFFTMNLAKVYFIRHDPTAWPQAAEIVFIIFTWLGYCNSAVNPIIYSMINRNFRNAFVKILTCKTLHLNRKSSRGHPLRKQISNARRRSTRIASWFISRRETFCRETVNIHTINHTNMLGHRLEPVTEVGETVHISDSRYIFDTTGAQTNHDSRSKSDPVATMSPRSVRTLDTTEVNTEDTISAHDSDTFL